MPAYKDGHLLVRGGWSDQPARYAALVHLIFQFEQKAQAKYDEVKQSNTEE